MTNFITAILAAATMFTTNISAEPAQTVEAENLYPMTTIVVEVNEEEDTVSVVDFNGEEWTFEGAEEWNKGDIASMIMDTKGTEIIYDDEIVSVKYDGWLDGNFGFDGYQTVVTMEKN